MQCATGPRICVGLLQSRWSETSGFGEARQGNWGVNNNNGVSGFLDFCTKSFLEGCHVGVVRKGETRGVILHSSTLGEFL